jgi:hypothetical protein
MYRSIQSPDLETCIRFSAPAIPTRSTIRTPASATSCAAVRDIISELSYRTGDRAIWGNPGLKDSRLPDAALSCARDLRAPTFDVVPPVA